MRKRRDVEAGGGKSPPAAQLIADLQQATPRAKLSNDQNDKLQADVSSLKQAMQAKRQGETVDQDELKATIDELHGIADSGALATERSCRSICFVRA